MSTATNSVVPDLAFDGIAVLPGVFADPADAWTAAHPVLAAAAADDALCRRFGPLRVVGEHTVPPPGVVQRPFQALHLDFGVPLGLTGSADVARYTLLHVDTAAPSSGAATRYVPLAALASQRPWPSASSLAARLQSRVDDPDAAEGILARIVEAADATAVLPAKTAAGFRCGLEFDDLGEENRFFARHGLDVVATERRVVLGPGQVLVFDNLHGAHGRIGVRATGELHQRCVGFAGLSPQDQTAVLHHVLCQLTGASPECVTPYRPTATGGASPAR